ncbi:glycine zipper 2TM domain-containing protein [Klebsiella michiganensis]|uniref:glycine zipper 2TM domain-containing protein n=1 Tax=Klebsiella michiganensis TaxID=1134687 RepID=UPI003D970002
MRRNIILSVIFLLTIVGCRGPSIDANDGMGNTFYGQEPPPSYGIVTGVNYITIQNDTGYNTVGTVSGGALGGITGHTLTGQRQAIVGIAAAGVLAGQAIQRRLARSQLVELFIRPTDGRDFVIVQPTRGTPFFVGQRVKVAYRRGNIVILPG